MASKFVTCPETAHLELIDYEPHPLGMLITGCTRFTAGCPVTCPRSCAARFDRRDRRPPEELEIHLDVGDVTALDLAPAPAR